VVDASGRNFAAVVRGIRLRPTSGDSDQLFCQSRWYRRPTGLRSEWQTLVWPKPPDSPRAGMLYPIEGDRWILTVAGVGRDYPPTDEAGFLEFTRSLRSSILYEAIKDAQPLSSIYGYRRTENHRRHYERDLSRWLCSGG